MCLVCVCVGGGGGDITHVTEVCSAMMNVHCTFHNEHSFNCFARTIST